MSKKEQIRHGVIPLPPGEYNVRVVGSGIYEVVDGPQKGQRIIDHNLRHIIRVEQVKEIMRKATEGA